MRTALAAETVDSVDFDWTVLDVLEVEIVENDIVGEVLLTELLDEIVV